MTVTETAGGVATAQRFLGALFGGKPAGHHVCVFTLDPKLPADHPDKPHSAWFTDLDAAARCAIVRSAAQDVYVGMATAPGDLGPKRRVKHETAAGIPGLWGDWDVAGPGHARADLPRSTEDVLAVIAEAFPPLPPSVVVRSGGGMHAYHLFKEFWVFADDADRAYARGLSDAYQATVRARATPHGWAFESTADLPRVLRIPGTLNHKSDPPAPVELIALGNGRCDPGDLEPFLVDEPLSRAAANADEGVEQATEARPIGPDVASFIAHGASAGHRRLMVCRLARAFWGALRTPEEAVAAACMGMRAGPQDGSPWSEKQIERIVRGVWKSKPPRAWEPPVTLRAPGVTVGGRRVRVPGGRTERLPDGRLVYRLPLPTRPESVPIETLVGVA